MTDFALADARDKAYERLHVLCGTRADAPSWADIATLLRERDELYAKLHGVAQSMWRPIESCPNNDDFRFYGVFVNRANGFSWFEVHYLGWDDEGVLRLPSGDCFDDWSYSDFTHWMPAPKPPTPLSSTQCGEK
jgi:hypothetical protein